MINDKLKTKLLKMMDKDQKMRSSGKWDKNVDKINTIEFKKVIEKNGWPDVRIVGKKASTGAWLMAQHADHDLKFQKHCLRLMNDKLKDGSLPSWQIAYLTDRVQVNNKLPQIYGTQFYLTKNKRFINRPIRNKSTLDKRRKEIGLESFDEYKIKLTATQKKIQKK
jgi:hypothetical protein